MTVSTESLIDVPEKRSRSSRQNSKILQFVYKIHLDHPELDCPQFPSDVTSHHEDLGGVVGLQEVVHARQCLHLPLLRLLVALLQDMATLKGGETSF